MKEELQHKLVEVIGSIQSAAGKASDFALEQLPDIAQSYVAYGRASATALAILSVLGLAGIAWLFKWTHHKVVKERYDEMIWMPVGIVGFIAGVLLLFLLLCSLQSALLVWFATKVWLLKELAGLIK